MLFWAGFKESSGFVGINVLIMRVENVSKPATFCFQWL
jgi:hypothetical protein